MQKSSREVIGNAYQLATELLNKVAYAASFNEHRYRTFVFSWEDELSENQQQELLDNLAAARLEIARQLAHLSEEILVAVSVTGVEFDRIAADLEYACAELPELEIAGLGSALFAWPILRDISGRVRIWAGSYATAFQNENLDPRYVQQLATECPFNETVHNKLHTRLMKEKSRLWRDYDTKPAKSETTPASKKTVKDTLKAARIETLKRFLSDAKTYQEFLTWKGKDQARTLHQYASKLNISGIKQLQSRYNQRTTQGWTVKNVTAELNRKQNSSYS